MDARIAEPPGAGPVAAAAPLAEPRTGTAAILSAVAFSWSSFALMTLMAVWNEGRPGRPYSDPVLAAVPYVPWLDHWNYWIWLLAWIPGLAALFVSSRPVFVRVMVAAGCASLLRGVCILATGLGPVHGPDVNAALDWDWTLRWRVVLQIVNPVSVFIDDSAHIWLTKDLFFSGHTCSTLLLVLFGWPFARLRWPLVVLHVVVVASVIMGHVHYAIDVLGGWVAAAAVFLAVGRGIPRR